MPCERVPALQRVGRCESGIHDPGTLPPDPRSQDGSAGRQGLHPPPCADCNTGSELRNTAVPCSVRAPHLVHSLAPDLHSQCEMGQTLLR